MGVALTCAVKWKIVANAESATIFSVGRCISSLLGYGRYLGEV